jgi:hypothetical protein
MIAWNRFGIYKGEWNSFEYLFVFAWDGFLIVFRGFLLALMPSKLTHKEPYRCQHCLENFDEYLNDVLLYNRILGHISCWMHKNCKL